MEQIMNQVIRFANQVGNSACSFNRETWILLSLVTVITGYLLLRGNANR